MSPGCLPSVRSRSCDRAKPSAFPVTFARKSSHPFARSVRSHPVEARRRSVLLRAVSVCLAAPLDGAEKMLLSDLCNRLTTRAPDDRSTSGRAACAALIAWCFPDPRVEFFLASPDRLAATWPRLGTRLTARLQLRSVRARFSFAFRLRRSGRRLAGAATSAWRFRPCARLTSDLWRSLSRPAAIRRNPDAFEEPGSLPPSTRQGGWLSRSEAPSLDRLLPGRAALATRLVWWEPATGLAV